MNQVFNYSRFIKYSNYRLVTELKQSLFLVGGMVLGILAFSFLTMQSDDTWVMRNWNHLFLLSYVICGVTFVANSFTYLRDDNACLNALMLPASLFEKYLFEFVSKILLVVLLFPVLFYFLMQLTPLLVHLYKPEMKIIPLTIEGFLAYDKGLPLAAFFIFYAILIAFIFAGTSTFKKKPLIKTIIFVGFLTAFLFGYKFVVHSLIVSNNPSLIVPVSAENIVALTWSAKFTILPVLFGFSIVLPFIYSFFKLKEKEVA